MKITLSSLFFILSVLAVKAQVKVKASDAVHVADNFVSCDNEILASFPGGMYHFNQYVKKNIHYPVSDIKHHIHGKVILTFIIERDGRISNVKIKKGVSPEIDAEAVRILKNSPKWIPTKNCGKARRTQFAIPINFSLDK